MADRKQFLVILAALLVLVQLGCAVDPGRVGAIESTAKSAKNAPKPLTLSLRSGEILSVIAIDQASGEAAATARSAYLEQAFGRARQHGLQAHGTLRVTATAVGSFSPGAVGFFSWPGVAAKAAFGADPTWPALKATRPAGWDELRVHDVILTAPLQLQFDPALTYTMATAWTDSAHPDHYDRYLAGIADAVAAAGGRFVLDVRDPQFEAHATDGGAPDRLIFVEWDSPQALSTFQESAAFKAQARYLRSGTTRFELLLLKRGS